MYRLSKSLSATLRHKAPEQGIPIRDDGYVSVASLLRHPIYRKYTVDDLHKVVEDNNKQRFTLKTDAAGKLWIKANQGHSLDLPDLELDTIDSAAAYPVVVHGTSRRAWELIKASGALSRMDRNHIHLATGLPGASGVISGMRSSSEIHVFVDMAAAIGDGIVFYRSPNGVILTEGLDGKLPLKYVQRVSSANGTALDFVTR